MEEPPTVRNENLEMAPLPAHVEVMLPLGRRHRCSLCYERGETVEADLMCHHCGRTICQSCAPRLARILRPYFEHNELKWLTVRGQYTSPADQMLGNAPFEPAHCPYHVHYAPRASAWIALGAIALLLGLLLALVQDNAALSLLLPLLLALVGGGLLYWQQWDSQQQAQPYFPLNAEYPLLEVREEFEAEATLDEGGYVERWSPENRRGYLRATIKLEPEMADELYKLQDAHGLDDYTLATLPARAGAVVLENVGRVQSPMPQWPEGSARRWELSAPLTEWPLVWGGKGPRSKTLEFPYSVAWQIPRLPFDFAFPVQVQAHFPERGDRRTLELLFMLTGWIPRLNPFFQEATIEADERLPAFRLLSSQGRPISGSSDRMLKIEDLRFDESNTAHVLLRFDEEIPYGAEGWLSGAVVVGVVGTFSDVKVDGVYDAYGHRVRSPNMEAISRARLRFRVNAGALPYQSTGRATREAILPGASALRDDAVLRALERRSRLVRVHETIPERAGPYPRQGARAPRRDVMGHWPEERLTEMNPVVYHLYFLPQQENTRVSTQVEAPVTSAELQSVQAMRVCEELHSIITEADASFRGVS